MRRQAQEEVAETARRRLEAVRRDPGETAPALGREVRPAGRHARNRSPALSQWCEDRVPTMLRGRVRLGGRELAVVVVLAAAGLVVAALIVLRAQGHATSAPLTAATSTPSVGSPSGMPGEPLVTPAAAPGASRQSPSAKVVVDVSGKVRHPGVVRLPQGARVIDAIRRAGGARPHVDLTGLNLAQVLTDGQQVLVGSTEGGAAASAAAVATPASGPMVHLNTASAQQLETLPGVGPVTASKILQWRASHGSFTSVDELLEVDGIGDKTLADLAPHVTL